jgi:hypothetical protein
MRGVELSDRRGNLRIDDHDELIVYAFPSVARVCEVEADFEEESYSPAHQRQPPGR